MVHEICEDLLPQEGVIHFLIEAEKQQLLKIEIALSQNSKKYLELVS